MIDLTTLYYRRLRAGVIQVYRIINRGDKLELSIFSHFNTRPSMHNSVSVLKPRALSAIRQNMISHRVLIVGMNYQRMLFWQILWIRLRINLSFFGSITFSNMK